jgi:hypothetical protein
MVIRLFFLLLFSSSLLLTRTAKAQYVSQWSLDAIRVGFDPLKSGSMLFNAEKFRDRKYFFNYTEAYLELLVHLRTSVILEGGYSHSKWNRYNNTYFYDSKGYFMKFGLDFNISEPHPDFELDLGWRIGINKMVENSELKLKGDYYGETVEESPIHKLPNSLYWGEIVLDGKTKIFRKSESKVLQNLWFQASFRLRFKPKDISEGYEQYYIIPGYGFNNRIMPGIHFTLSYFIKFRERKVYRIHHAYDSKVLIYKH